VPTPHFGQKNEKNTPNDIRALKQKERKEKKREIKLEGQGKFFKAFPINVCVPHTTSLAEHSILCSIIKWRGEKGILRKQ